MRLYVFKLSFLALDLLSDSINVPWEIYKLMHKSVVNAIVL